MEKVRCVYQPNCQRAAENPFQYAAIDGIKGGRAVVVPPKKVVFCSESIDSLLCLSF